MADPARLQRYLSPRPERGRDRRRATPAPSREVALLLPEGEMPWAGHMAIYAAKDVYRLIEERRVTLVFVNTRAQAELMFGALWRLNKANLPIALHHGSLAVEQRRKVEAAMAAGTLRAVVCTSSLDLGIDWGDIDLVVQVGAPKGAARLLQRIGRANHRLDEPSRAALVPGQPVRGAGMHRRPGRAGTSTRWTAARCSPAASTCWRSTSPASPAPARSTPTRSTPRSARRRPSPTLPAPISTRCSSFVATGGYALRDLRALPPAGAAARTGCGG